MDFKRLQRRLESLEKRLKNDPIVLFMSDGRTETLCGRGDYVADLFRRGFSGEQSPEIELIRRSVSSTEPGNGQMIDLLRAVANSPA